MARDDWLRRSTWSPHDRDEFRARLNRSRDSRSKAQYLRIQAHHLQEVGHPPLLEAALQLLEEVVQEHPDPMQLAAAHQQRAECLSALERPEEAIEAYRQAFAAERAFPHIRGTAYLGFAELVLSMGRDDLYPEALAILGEFARDELFPVVQYRSHAARAFLLEALGQDDPAMEHARSALEAAAESESPFRYHRKLGLVDTPDEAEQQRLRGIAGESRPRAT